MEELLRFCKEEYNYDSVKNRSYLSIEYDFLKYLNKEKRKEVRKRLKDFNEILRFVTKNEAIDKRFIFIEREGENIVESFEDKRRIIKIHKPNFMDIWRLKFSLNINAPNKIGKNELFDVNKLEHYLLFGN